MTALALALALSGQTPQAQATPQWVPPWYGKAGRLYTASDDSVHVGGRIALFVDNEGGRAGGQLEMGVGMTVQVTAFVP